MGLLSKMFSKEAEPSAPAPDAAARWSPQAVTEILRQFPIGSRVLYAPEAKRELRLESVLMGYSIDGHLVYAREEVSKETGGGRPHLRLKGEGPDLLLQAIRSFYMVVPFQRRTEIDFTPSANEQPVEKLVQKPVNDFERGNLLTVFCFSPYGRVPNIGTLVRSSPTLSTGPYANQRVAFLDPLANTLCYTDKRRFHRLKTDVPVLLQACGQAGEAVAALEDFSERFVRIRLREEGFQSVAEGTRLVLTLALAPVRDPVALQGVVSRRRRDALIVELKAVLKDGRFSEFQLVDQIEIKSALLHHPSTGKGHGGPDA